MPKENLTDTQKNRNFVNTPMDDDLKDKLDIMAKEDAGHPDNVNYAALIRKLIYQEWERRVIVRNQLKKMREKGLLPK